MEGRLRLSGCLGLWVGVGSLGERVSEGGAWASGYRRRVPGCGGSKVSL